MSFNTNGYAKQPKTSDQNSAALPAHDHAAASSLTPAGRQLIARLVDHVTVDEVTKQVPHIINKLALVWGQPASVHQFLETLLLDDRVGRQGFPVVVFKQLLKLRSYYSKLYPKKVDAWDQNLLR